ncbi:suppressor [Corchorus yellow vein mosaic betasatellite]|uniref:Suppressor n=1 Tax=Corchorus yellow vein mosaic betasatellite TaxID=1297646 RepID=M1QRV5_9VIRU|nr:suppressor [Corchorus yellow vein mosaic betasatellite]AGG18219.1 suppressor [Corchorus yellow vein mosaic betasatellite]
MTIHYTNNKGLRFTIKVHLQGTKFVMVTIDFFSTRAPALIKRRFRIPYGHEGIIPPFDFNGLELGIQGMIDLLYKDATLEKFKEEEMIEMIDILMMQDANVEAINLDVEYDVSRNVSA